MLEATDIFIGVNALDYSGYPDCRPNYIRAFEDMANLATRLAIEDNRKIRIRAPLIDLSKSQIIQRESSWAWIMELLTRVMTRKMMAGLVGTAMLVT